MERPRNRSWSPSLAALLIKQKPWPPSRGVSPEAIYSYADFEKISSNPQIQAVYVVLPNGLHKKYVIRAAKAGKHVLCEKPMANSSAEAREMIAACKQAGRLLMVAYRSQYEPNNRNLLKMLREEKYGPLRLMSAVNVQSMAAPEQWRFKKGVSQGRRTT